MLKVYWFGYGGNSVLAEELRPVINELGMSLTCIHEWDNADIKWQLDTWLSELRKADIIIIPAFYQRQPSKSANRLSQSLALGKPVICSPLDAYLQVAKKHPDSFLIATTPEEWKEKLIQLRDDHELRDRLSQKALEAAKDYSIDAIGEKWISVLTSNDITDIIIPTRHNLKCLKHCIESIRACTDTPYQLIVVNNGQDEETHQYLSQLTNINYIKTEGRLTFSQANNMGIAAGKSKYVCLLNDDTIVSKGWLRELVKACTGDVGGVGPLSNCDQGWLHQYQLSIGGVNLGPGTNTLEQIEPIIPQIYDYRSEFDGRYEQKWIAFYCILIPREVINKVGILDEGFTNTGEDVDYCYRIRKQGYRIIQNYKSFIFHAGAVGRKVLESENYEAYHEADKQTNVYLNAKWGKESVVIYTGPAWERWDWNNVDKGGIGGSETWLVCLARELSKLNYRVTVFGDFPGQKMMDPVGNVEYLHYTQYPRYVEQNWIDYFITSRTTDTLGFPIRAGKIYVQIHDIWLSNDKNYPLYMDKVTKFCVLSKWHWDFVKSHHGIPDEKLSMTMNGLDFGRYKVLGVERNPYRLIYSSSPDRGLDTLLYLFDFIKAEIPQLELHVLYGFFNWESAIRQRNNDWEMKKMEEIKAGLNKPGVFNHGRVGQKELAIEQLRSSLWAYPTSFTETHCITALECQRARVPVIASNFAGLQTTIGDSGILLGQGYDGESYTKEYREKFVAECISILKDRDKWQYWSERGYQNTEKRSWADVALLWQKLFKE